MSTKDNKKDTLTLSTSQFRVNEGARPQLESIPSREGEDGWKKRAKQTRADLCLELLSLQEKLYASRDRSVLVVLQAMDAAGKDSTIRRCFGPLNPQRCRTHSFKQPSLNEKDRDPLWRYHYRVPRKGTIGVFNRSHYESVLIERVNQLASPSTIQKRYEHINSFERMLAEEGLLILKFYLHVSKDYQKSRFERRLRRPDKQWKFSENDLSVREKWPLYMNAYETAFERCSTSFAPWYIIPAERRWFRDVAILQTIVETLRKLDLSFPQPEIDLDSVRIPD